MNYTFSYAPMIPVPILIGIAIIALAFIGFGLFRGLKAWFWRGLSIAFLLLALLAPQLNEEEREGLSNIVFVVVDQTASQSLSDRQSQINEALSEIQSEMSTRRTFEVREIVVGNDLSDRDSGSLILTALSDAAAEVADTRIAGAILITDGRIHDAEALVAFPAPVHLVQTGRETDWDKRLRLINAPKFGIVDEEMKLRFRIEEDGEVPSELRNMAVVNILIDGEEFGTFQLPTNEDIDLPLSLPHAGANIVQIQVEPQDGELTDRNNNVVLSINGVRDRLRVLLVSGEPHAGERVWRNLLKSDSTVDLVHFTILRPPEKVDGVPVRELSLIAFPTRELFQEKIDEFDLIIFDRYRRRGMLAGRYLDNVVDYVNNGGAVLVAVGKSFAAAESLFRSEVSTILPARPTSRIIEKGFHPKITELGERHPVTQGLEEFSPIAGLNEGVSDPEWGRWFRLIEVESNKGDVVMTGADDKPLLILDRVGEGRVSMLLSDHAWLWSRGFEGGGPQLEMLRRLAHWMMKEPELEEERLFAEVNGTTVTVTRRSLNDDPKSLAVTRPDDTTETFGMIADEPGTWVQEFEGVENGLYRLKEGDVEAVVAIGPALPIEFDQAIASGEALEPLQKATRGGQLLLDNTPRPDIRIVREGRVASGSGWLGIVDRQAYVTTAIRQSPILPSWAYLLIAAVLAVFAWWREGRRVSG
ncbi:MAG: hypothetical protein AAF429_14175 [Pseudomonadota bacterium]